MPERNPTAVPQIVNGGTLESGTPSTGQVQFTFGGTRQYTRFSGVAPDQQIQLGAGRLESAELLTSQDQVASGIAIVFYDAAVAGAAGPVPGSGHKLLGMLIAAPGSEYPGGRVPYVSGMVLAEAGLQIRKFGTVYTSGLCISSISGNPGCLVNYTAVVSG